MPANSGGHGGGGGGVGGKGIAAPGIAGGVGAGPLGAAGAFATVCGIRAPSQILTTVGIPAGPGFPAGASGGTDTTSPVAIPPYSPTVPSSPMPQRHTSTGKQRVEAPRPGGDAHRPGVSGIASTGTGLAGAAASVRVVTGGAGGGVGGVIRPITSSHGSRVGTAGGEFFFFFMFYSSY